ncbi:MAG: hypothetical protein KF724_08985 [Phycisphaeraceae bacterium]|nr:hypothetical protein [Phycisphaeraceae bacterium]
MHLTKWYMDATSIDGRCALLYWASLNWMGCHFRWSSVLTVGPEGAPREWRSRRRSSAPQEQGTTLAWTHPHLQVRGEWDRAAPAVECDLLPSAPGAVRWHCVHPRSRAVVEVGDERIEGWGYAERLELSIPPWKLPIDELQWGRFCGDGAGAVWIRWSGQSPLSLLVLDGEVTRGADIGLDRVESARCVLDLDAPTTLRSGTLGTTVLRSTPLLRCVLPASLRSVEETKWLSAGRLMQGGGRATPGWAVHERVIMRSETAR